MMKTPLQLCHEFDAVDLSECAQKLDHGEPFDAACEAAIAQRVRLGECLETILGAEFVESYEQSAAQREPWLPEVITYIAERTHRESLPCGCAYFGSKCVQFCKQHTVVKSVDVLVEMIGSAACQLYDVAAEEASKAYARMQAFFSEVPA